MKFQRDSNLSNHFWRAILGIQVVRAAHPKLVTNYWYISVCLSNLSVTCYKDKELPWFLFWRKDVMKLISNFLSAVLSFLWLRKLIEIVVFLK